MVRCDVLDKPYFAVPPDDPRIGLLFAQVDGPVQTSGFVYESDDGRLFVSPRIYFGTILSFGVGPGDAVTSPAEDGELGAREAEARRAVLGSAADSAAADVRIDFAWLDGRTVVLRAGAPGARPRPFSEFGRDGLASLRDYVEEFMESPYADVVMSRAVMDAEDDILFEGEERFLEGFIGQNLLPLEVCADESGALVCEGLAMAPEGSAAYDLVSEHSALSKNQGISEASH